MFVVKPTVAVAAPSWKKRTPWKKRNKRNDTSRTRTYAEIAKAMLVMARVERKSRMRSPKKSCCWSEFP